MTASICRIVHVLALGLWAGAALFFSFVVAPAIFGYLRDQLPENPPLAVQGITKEAGRRLAGDTVGAIFPAYFALQIAAGTLAVASGAVLATNGQLADKIRCVLAAVALTLAITHRATVYPHSVLIRQEQYQAKEAGEDEEAAELEQAFRVWHGISQLLNLATILPVVIGLGLAPRSSPLMDARRFET
jgi:hypothetical protein